MFFVSNDLSQKTLASLFLNKSQIISIENSIDNYNGYLDITFSEEDLTYLYQ